MKGIMKGKRSPNEGSKSEVKSSLKVAVAASEHATSPLVPPSVSLPTKEPPSAPSPPPFLIHPDSFEVDALTRRARAAVTPNTAFRGNTIQQRLVDMNGMRNTVAAWPRDEFEGLLLYCERLREEKLLVEQKLAEVHTDRALTAARDMVAVTGFKARPSQQLTEAGPPPSHWSGTASNVDSRAYRPSNKTSQEDFSFLARNYDRL